MPQVARTSRRKTKRRTIRMPLLRPQSQRRTRHKLNRNLRVRPMLVPKPRFGCSQLPLRIFPRRLKRARKSTRIWREWSGTSVLRNRRSILRKRRRWRLKRSNLSHMFQRRQIGHLKKLSWVKERGTYQHKKRLMKRTPWKTSKHMRKSRGLTMLSRRWSILFPKIITINQLRVIK